MFLCCDTTSGVTKRGNFVLKSQRHSSPVHLCVWHKWSWYYHQFYFVLHRREIGHTKVTNLLCVFRVMESWRCRQEQGRPSPCCPSLLPTRRWVELCVHMRLPISQWTHSNVRFSLCQAFPLEVTKLIYCSRTVPEIEKVSHKIISLSGQTVPTAQSFVKLKSSSLNTI